MSGRGADLGRTSDATASGGSESDGLRATVERRLQELRAEFAIGERELQEVAYREREARETMMRIAGAVQVLQELLAAADSKNGSS